MTGIEKYFKKIFSATSDFGRVKREEDIYRMVCERMNVTPAEIIHIGDHREFDFEAPQRIGIRSYFSTGQRKRPDRRLFTAWMSCRISFHAEA